MGMTRSNSEARHHSHRRFRVSTFAQTPDEQGRRQVVIDTPSQSVRSPIQLAEPELIWCPWARSETSRAKGNIMQVPEMFTGESLRRLVQGAIVGMILTVAVGFSWFGYGLGWKLGSAVESVA